MPEIEVQAKSLVGFRSHQKYCQSSEPTQEHLTVAD